jgi:hypothetical protein
LKEQADMAARKRRQRQAALLLTLRLAGSIPGRFGTLFGTFQIFLFSPFEKPLDDDRRLAVESANDTCRPIENTLLPCGAHDAKARRKSNVSPA